MSDLNEKALAIISATHDGEDLAPEHLKLVENAVNGFLNEAGVQMFGDLHEQVTTGHYNRPWLQGVENLTRDHEGYVYWKGKHIDHWSGDLPYSEEGKVEGEELARRCKILEGRERPVNGATVIWTWQE